MPSISTLGTTPKTTVSTIRAPVTTGLVIIGVSTAAPGPDRPASKVSVNADRSSSVSVTRAERQRAMNGPGSGSGSVGPASSETRIPGAATGQTPGAGITISDPSAGPSTSSSGSSARLTSQIRQKAAGSPR